MTIGKLVILGSGQLGASLALTAARAHPGLSVTVLDVAPREAMLKRALSRANLKEDRVTLTCDPAAAAGADLLVLAVPLSLLHAAVRWVAPYVTAHTVFTELSSPKRAAQTRMREALDAHVSTAAESVPFYLPATRGGGGAVSADASVFAARGVLISGVASLKREELVETFFTSLGTVVFRLDATVNDQLLASVSDLQSLIAAAFTRMPLIQELERGSEELQLGGWALQGQPAFLAFNTVSAESLIANREEIGGAVRNFRRMLLGLSQHLQAERTLEGACQDVRRYWKNRASSFPAAFDWPAEHGGALRASALIGLLSLATGAHVRRLELVLDRQVKPLINPGFLAALAPIVKAPHMTSALLEICVRAIEVDVKEFLVMLDSLLEPIERGDETTLLQRLKGEANLHTQAQSSNAKSLLAS